MNNISKKKLIEKKPKKLDLSQTITQGNKKIISISKIKKRIETK